MAYTTLKEEQKFEFTYSATQQEEVEKIRKKYLPKQEDKMEILRKLDKRAETPGMVAALAVGIFGTLLLGVGMCCVMVWAEVFFVGGIVAGILGMAILGIAYPLYKKITKKQREKIADRILELSAELSL